MRSEDKNGTLPPIPSDDFGFYLFRLARNPQAPEDSWSTLCGEYPPPLWRITQDEHYATLIEAAQGSKPEKTPEEQLKEMAGGRAT